MQVSEEEVTRLVSSSLDNSTLNNSREFSQFTFCPRTIPDKDSVSAMFSMFSQPGMLSRWRIARDSLARFILLVRRGYRYLLKYFHVYLLKYFHIFLFSRSPPYHNWCHGFTVAHFVYLVLQNSSLLARGLLTHLEAFALMIAAMCHDLDHRGTNNSYQISSNSVLACLYSSEGSVMERHHFAQSM